MGWFTKNRKEKISLEQIAEHLYFFTKKFAMDFVFHEMKNQNSPFKSADENTFIHERTIFIFWIIDKFFSDEDKKLISAVHKVYFSDLGIQNNRSEAEKEISFIMKRYNEYHDLYDKNDGVHQSLLSSAVAKNILGKEKPILNFLTTSRLVIDIPLIISALKETIFNKYEIGENKKVKVFDDDESIEKQKEEVSRLPSSVDSLKKAVLSGEDCDQVSNASGEFGLSPNNPIPVNCQFGEIKYLNRLHLKDGPRVIFHRLG